LAVVALGTVYFVYVLARFFFSDDVVPGWASLISVELLLGGLQILFVGIVGERLGLEVRVAIDEPQAAGVGISQRGSRRCRSRCLRCR
ncbi:MAG: hypothetical protein ACC726_10830, partial [Chloroflexota bacterium]